MGSRSAIRLRAALVLCLLYGVGASACTPANSLDPQGPWLVLGTALDGRTMDGMLALNADGSGVTHLIADQVIVGPNDFGSALSPDGRHLAYLTASDTGFHDLTLNLLSLPDGKTEVITPLLNPSTAPAADAHSLADPSYSAANAIAAQDRSLAWSPDGSRLAFVGAQAGASADLYLYVVQDQTITRISDETEQAMRPLWSPDGQTIVFQTYQSFEIAGGFDLGPVWAVDAEGGRVHEVYAPGPVEEELFVGWVSDTQVLVFSRDLACGWHNLRFVDEQDGADSPLWPGYFNKMSYHSESGSFLISIDTYTAACNADALSGLMVLLPDEAQWRTLADFAPVELASAADGFYAVTLEPAVFTIDLSGDISRLPDPIAFVPIASPDDTHWAWAGQHPKFEAGLWVGPSGAAPDLIYEGAVQVVTWMPDSTGLFFVGDNDLYLWRPADDSPTLLESGVVLRDFRGAVWAVLPDRD